MATVLVAYGTGEGQTAKVAERLAAALADRGHDAEAVDAASPPAGFDPGEYDAVLVGSSVHAGRHRPSVRAFVEANREVLAAVPSGFFQVSMSSAFPDDETRRAQAAGYADRLFEETGWHPDRVGFFGGALRYSEYGFLTRLLVKQLAKRSTGDTDTSRDYEYTDWDAVAAFADDFTGFVAAYPDAQPVDSPLGERDRQ